MKTVIGKSAESGIGTAELGPVLDSWAVLALLRDEPSGPRVVDALRSGGARMSWINLGEAYYSEVRRLGSERARDAIDHIQLSMIVEVADAELTLNAAGVKAAHPISYADCFAVATAERHRAPLLTGHPELIELERPNLEVVDLRS